MERKGDGIDCHSLCGDVWAFTDLEKGMEERAEGVKRVVERVS